MRASFRIWLVPTITLFVSISRPSKIPAQEKPAPPPSVFAVRQERVYALLGRDLLIVRSRWSPANWSLGSFEQLPNFYYFTGADRLLAAVLVLDGAKGRAELFLPGTLAGVMQPIAAEQPPPADAPASSLHVDRVAEWSAFAPYLDARLAADPGLTIWSPGSM
jgi:hypothetical protein